MSSDFTAVDISPIGEAPTESPPNRVIRKSEVLLKMAERKGYGARDD